jgi:4-amino-4-deoxychorismate lyase
MFPLFESIKVTNNSLQNLEYHNRRVNHSRKQLFGAKDEWNLSQMIKLPELDSQITYKCRFVYQEEALSTEFQPYTIKQLSTLKKVELPDFDYDYKYLDRTKLNALKANNPEADDILIVQRNKITDCSYANIVFFDGKKWLTPSNPLLRGTKRQMYIDNQIISEQEITIFDLKLFTKARIINAMIDIDQCYDIAIDAII